MHGEQERQITLMLGVLILRLDNQTWAHLRPVRQLERRPIRAQCQQLDIGTGAGNGDGNALVCETADGPATRIG